ncbi:MAG: hypothetical protein J6R32_04555 [Bacteroidales bacterium]|nr:hypothetical protein [Bacteroidales bacterium]
MARKWYNEEYYDTYTDREWKAGSNNDPDPFAFCVPRNIWGYYTDMVPGNTEHWGKPYDPSIALWKLNTRSLIATNASIEIEQSNLITPHYYYTENDAPVPLIMAGINQGYESTAKLYGYPSYRIADDYSYSQGNERSFLCFDVSYKNIVLCPKITALDRTDGTEHSFTSLPDLLDFLDSFQDDQTALGLVLQYDIYRGPKIPRAGSVTEWSPPEGGEASWTSWIMLDNYSYRPIPDDPNIKIRVQDQPGVGPHPDWRDDAIFSPFLSVLSDPWYKYEYTTSPPYLSALGYNVDFTCYDIINGYAQIDWSSYRATGFWARMNTTLKTFNEVSYHWKNSIYDMTNLRYVQEGHDITNYSSGDTFKFISEIVIDDKDEDLSYHEAIIHAIIHELAYIGFYIADNPITAANKITGSETDGIGLFLPIFDGDTPTGDYVTGEDIKDQPNADAESAGDIIPPDPNAYEGSTPDLNTYVYEVSSVNVYAALNSFQWLIENINSLPTEYESDILTPDSLFFGADPYDYIIGYYLVPIMFIPPDAYSLSSYDYIHIGKFNTSMAQSGTPATGYPITIKTPLRRLLIDKTVIPRYFNNFLDYEPHTSLSLYIPFYGTVDLPPSIFMGHKLSVYSSYDMISGTCSFMIYVDNIQYKVVSANVRLEVPINALDISKYAELMTRTRTEKRENAFNFLSTSMSAIGRGGTAATISALKGNDVGALGSLVGMSGTIAGNAMSASSRNDLYNTILERTTPEPSTISLGSVPDGCANTLRPYVICNRPKLASGFKTDIYASTTGYACYENDKIGNFEGFTVIENPILDDLAISAKEKEMLRKLLSSGVILPPKGE